jgi:hypothetical protein
MNPASHPSNHQLGAATWCWHLIPERSVYAFLADHRQQVAHAHHTKVNDAALASRGEPQLALRTMMPISLHQEQLGQANGNQDESMVVPLPLGEPDPFADCT